jgi:hypothetical protein
MLKSSFKSLLSITIANSDAESTSLLDVAIDQAHRAVHELSRTS